MFSFTSSFSFTHHLPHLPLHSYPHAKKLSHSVGYGDGWVLLIFVFMKEHLLHFLVFKWPPSPNLENFELKICTATYSPGLAQNSVMPDIEPQSLCDVTKTLDLKASVMHDRLLVMPVQYPQVIQAGTWTKTHRFRYLLCGIITCTDPGIINRNLWSNRLTCQVILTHLTVTIRIGMLVCQVSR